MPARLLRASVAACVVLAAGAPCGCGVAAGEDRGATGEASGATSAAPPASTSAPAGPAPKSDADAGAAEDAGPPGRPAGDIVLVDEDLYPDTLPEQRAAMFRRMSAALGLSEAAMDRVRAIFGASKNMGQGNPKATQYPLKRRACREKRAAAGVIEPEHPACGAPFMVPVHDPSAGQTEKDARVCIDAYEFPGVPCEHPVVWVSAREAYHLCAAVGKRLCDAHEWEGACAGAVHAPAVAYPFGRARKEMRRLHNQDREIVWSYGPAKEHGKCATMSQKSKGCTASGRACGSNTYPAGSFPECRSPFGAYDLHGNAAEHMNFPMKAEELASAGGSGQTEMKGSWFIFSSYEAHPDDCRWRAPDWHVTKLLDRSSHANYHLGFRCCKDIR